MFLVLFFIALGVVAEVAELSTESIDWLMVIFTVLIEALIFWRINVHLNYINT